MKISTPVAVTIIALALGIAGVSVYQRYQAGLSGTTVAAANDQIYAPFHTEERWTVQQIGQFIADLAALAKGAPTQPVEAKPSAPSEGPSKYQIRSGSQTATTSLAGGVWNPSTYAAWAKSALGNSQPPAGNEENLNVAEQLLSPSFGNLHTINKAVSKKLQSTPCSAGAHVDAALLLGTIGLNDYAGCFRDTRPVLNRMVAHLAVADALGASMDQPDRRLAEAIRLTLCGQQADALKVIDAGDIPAQWSAGAWWPILRWRNTDDWRGKSEEALTGPPAAQYEYFRTLAQATSLAKATDFLAKIAEQPNLEYSRIAGERSFSVSEGHFFIRPWAQKELVEAIDAAKAFGVTSSGDNFAALQEYLDTPAGSPVTMEDGKPLIQVAGRNLFAPYHQRHLLQCLHDTYVFLHDRWGVDDEAQSLKEFVANKLPALTYKPLLERLMARTPAEREKANKACIELIEKQTPLVTSALWSQLDMDDDGNRLGMNIPDYHPWFRPEVPQGTAYEVDERLYDIGVGDENDLAWIKELKTRAPYSYPLARQLVYISNGGNLQNPPSALILEYVSPLVDYEFKPMRMLASSYAAQPKQYEEWMTKLAELDNDAYTTLADYFVARGMNEDAAKYYLLAFEKMDDRVRMANSSQWIVEYLYNKGDLATAEQIATNAAEVYSARGLDTYMWLMEQMGRWDEALKTARSIDERYNGGQPCAELGCLVRQQRTSPELAENPDFKALLVKFFPDGLQKADLASFTESPRKGVLINNSSKSLVDFGLRNQQVIVALDGYRTDTVAQYNIVREINPGPHLSIIAWNGSKYVLLEGEVPRKRFGVDIVDYKGN